MDKSTSTLSEKIAKSTRIASLKTDRRGIPVPFIVLCVEGREPDFTINDTHLVMKCVEEGLCSICGDALGDDVWFIGGPVSGFDPRGAYRDPPVHHECGQFALQVCPYLAMPSYSGMKPAAREKALREIYQGGEALGFVDPTVSPGKPQQFVFAKATGFHAKFEEHVHTMLPNRPFEEVEEWVDGKLVSFARPGDPDYAQKQKAYRKKGLESLKAARIKFSELPATHKKAWLGKLEGSFPWTK